MLFLGFTSDIALRPTLEVAYVSHTIIPAKQTCQNSFSAIATITPTQKSRLFLQNVHFTIIKHAPLHEVHLCVARDQRNQGRSCNMQQILNVRINETAEYLSVSTTEN